MTPQETQKLLSVMQQLAAQHKALSKLLDEQITALIASDDGRLVKITQKMEIQVERIQAFEETRLAALKAFADEFHLSPVEVRVTSVIDEETDTTLKERLVAVTGELKQVMAEITKKNERAAMLTKQSVDYLQKLVTLVAGQTRPTGYGKPAPVPSRFLNLET